MADKVGKTTLVTITRSRIYKRDPGTPAVTMYQGEQYHMKAKDANFWLANGWAILGNKYVPKEGDIKEKSPKVYTRSKK